MPTDTAPVQTHVITDVQHRQTPVARFILPDGWQAKSDVRWIYENISQPVTIYSIAYNPRGFEYVEMLPMESFYWLQPNYGFDRPGSFKFGQFFLQPMPAEQTMLQWTLPRYRGNREALRVLATSKVPDLAARIKLPAQQSPLESIMTKIEYMEKGQLMEEEIYAVMIVQQAPPSYGTGGTIIQTNWGFLRLFCFRAIKGQLDSVRPKCWQIIESVQQNPAWEQEVYTPIIQQMQQSFQQHLQSGYDQINAATQMSRMISAQNDSFLQHQQQKRDADWNAYQQQKQQSQHSADYTKEDAFGDMIMGRETYNDPYYQYGSQHSGYNQYVWTDGQGQYQYSNDANFNPNIGGTASWSLMEKKNVNS